MAVISVQNLSKKFKIPHEKKTTLFQNIVGLIKRQLDYEVFWAINNVNFEIERGESFGIIGNNGSGKSTLLKILAKVIYPDSGSVTVNGKIASFLELGVGFQPELTAKENVYIYSSIMGMKRKEVDKKYAAILDFAELKHFENMKLKNMSSGMYLRLAFSTAIYTDPEVLLIDEVFAVGDQSFQNKCTEKLNEFRKQGKTIVLVSHSLELIKEICSRSLLLDKGNVISYGDSEQVVNFFGSTHL